jgi:DNA-binding CsgD family transcriptional regulator
MLKKHRVPPETTTGRWTTSLGSRIVQLLVVLCLLWPISGFSQYHHIGVPEIINFSKADYRAGTQSWNIVQDDHGVLYFANNKGVLVFDATRWELVEMPNQTVVRSLAAGPDGTIMVGAQNELGVLTQSNSGSVRYRSLVETLPEDLLSFEDVWKIFPAVPETYFCSQKGVLRWQNDQWDVVRPTGRFENFFRVNGQILAQDIGRGLVRLQGDSFELLPGGEQFATGRVAEVLPHADLGFLVVSESKGLFVGDGSGITAWKNPASDFLITHKAYCATSLANGGYAVGTVQNGLIVLNTDGEIQVHLNKTSGLQNNTILSLWEDQQANFWLGLDNGIDYVRITGPFSVIRSEAGIEGTGYATVVHKENLYIGTNQGLFYRSWVPGGEQQATTFRKVENLEGQIWGLDQIGGNLIACAHDGAFLIRNGRASRISTPVGVWKFFQLKDQPNYAIAGTYTGLLLFQKISKGGAVDWQFVRQIDGFSESARVMEQDEEGLIWISHTYKGLYRVELSEDLQYADARFYNTDDGLPTDISINVVKVRGEVIFTTPQGVYLYDSSENRFIAHEKFNQVLGGIKDIHRLVEDQNGQIWFSVEDEFGQLKVAEEGFLQEVQLESFYFNNIQEQLVDGFENIYAYGSDVFIGTEKGVLHYDSRLDQSQNQNFEVLIRQVVLLNPTSPDSASRLISLDRSQEFARTENAFRFVYAAPFFESIGSLEYRYQLQGFSNGWSAWDHRTEKEFTNLPPGEYEFKVEAKNAYGQISASDSFIFSVSPPWYATNLARVVFGILLVLLVGGVLWYYSRKIERERQAVYREQSQHLEQKEAEFQEAKERTEAEIIRLRNENLRSDIKHKTSQLASATMHLVQKGEMLVKIKQELDKVYKTVPAENKRKVQQLIRLIDDDIRLDNNWEQFEVHFDQVHENFLKKLRERYPNLTPKDQKLCAYLRMNLATKEIAPLLNISVRGVEIARYRLRKKLELDTDTNLTDFIMKFRWE